MSELRRRVAVVGGWSQILFFVAFALFGVALIIVLLDAKQDTDPFLFGGLAATALGLFF